MELNIYIDELDELANVNDINIDSVNRARQFIKALPIAIPFPEIAVDPDGEISFEWYHSPH